MHSGVETIEKWGNVECTQGLKLLKSGETANGVETIEKCLQDETIKKWGNGKWD